jgi:replicative DNA helicase
LIKTDRKIIVQILGCLMKRPQILSDIDKYQLEVSDFTNQLDKFVFSAIYNLYQGGAESIHTIDIDMYLQSNSLAKDIMQKENGIGFLQDCEAYCEIENFNYYYSKLKKINLLRDLQKAGRDISEFYSENPLDANYNKINEKFEVMTTEDIINSLKGEIATFENKYVLNSVIEESNAYDGVKDLIEELKTIPEVGCPLQGDIFNTIIRGGRKGKMYLRSGSTSIGKTRSMVGDACNIAYPIRYEPKIGRWVATGHSEKILYVMTEQDPAEIQTMILAYLTGYNEEMFLYGTYTEEHMGRINKAIRIMETYKDNMLFARVPDPCASVIKNLFRKYSFQYGVENFFYDYIFSSPAMLNEYRDLKLPEHVCLRLFTTTLKNLAVELNAFILTSTQISGDDDENGGFRDYKRIRGSRSISDLVDCGCIMSRPSNEELKEIANFQKRYNFTPNCITDVFKNRRGRWNMVRIWSRKDLGTCRTYDLFITTADNKPIEDFQIVDFESIDTKKIRELEAIYNDGEIIAAPDFDESLTMVSEEPPESLLESVEKAFGDDEDNKKRLQDVEIGDLL